MYKRLLALLLAFVLVFALLLVSAFVEGEGQEGADGEPQAAAAGALRVQLNIAEGVTVPDYDRFSMRAYVYDCDGFFVIGVWLDSSTGFCGEMALLPGSYTLKFEEFCNFSEYVYEEIEPVEFTVEAGKDLTIERELKYADLSERATVNVELDFDPESSVTDAEAPSIYVYVRRDETNFLAASAGLTCENGRAATLYLEPGEYNISFAVYKADGNMAKIEDVRGFVVEEGETYSVSRTVKYETEATVCVKLNIAEGVTVPDYDHFIMNAYVYDCDGIFVAGVGLSVLTGFCGDMALLPGSYTLKFEELYNLSEYEYEEIEPVEFTVEAGDDLTIERELKYDLSEMATVNVELDFDPESSVTDAEAPEIDVYVRRYKTGKLVASAELTYENGRAATFYLKPGEYRISFGYNYEMDGHIVNAIEDATLTVEAGETYNISRTVKYFAAETPATAP